MLTTLGQCQKKMPTPRSSLSSLRFDSNTLPASKKSDILCQMRFVLEADTIKSMMKQVDGNIALLHLFMSPETW